MLLKELRRVDKEKYNEEIHKKFTDSIDSDIFTNLVGFLGIEGDTLNDSIQKFIKFSNQHDVDPLRIYNILVQLENWIVQGTRWMPSQQEKELLRKLTLKRMNLPNKLYRGIRIPKKELEENGYMGGDTYPLISRKIESWSHKKKIAEDFAKLFVGMDGHQVGLVLSVDTNDIIDNIIGDMSFFKNSPYYVEYEILVDEANIDTTIEDIVDIQVGGTRVTPRINDIFSFYRTKDELDDLSSIDKISWIGLKDTKYKDAMSSGFLSKDIERRTYYSKDINGLSKLDNTLFPLKMLFEDFIIRFSGATLVYPKTYILKASDKNIQTISKSPSSLGFNIAMNFELFKNDYYNPVFFLDVSFIETSPEVNREKIEHIKKILGELKRMYDKKFQFIIKVEE